MKKFLTGFGQADLAVTTPEQLDAESRFELLDVITYSGLRDMSSVAACVNDMCRAAASNANRATGDWIRMRKFLIK